MNATTSLILLVVLLFAWIWVKRGQDSDGQKKRPRSRPQRKSMAADRKPVPSSEFHAVAIKFSDNACDAAKVLESKRFLSNEAPRLPLPECQLLKCNCRFVHFKDRRARSNRRSPFRGAISVESGKYEQEKRTAKDRRAEPPDDF